MIFGAYILVWWLVYRLGALALRVAHRDRGGYARQSVLWAGLALVAFVALSAATGLLRFGVATSYAYPQDYLAYGPGGWLIMLVPALGVASPLLLAGTAIRRQMT